MAFYCPPVDRDRLASRTKLIHYLPDINHPEGDQVVDIMNLLHSRLESMQDTKVASWMRKCILDILGGRKAEEEATVAAQLVDLLGIDEVALVGEILAQKEAVLRGLSQRVAAEESSESESEDEDDTPLAARLAVQRRTEQQQQQLLATARQPVDASMRRNTPTTLKHPLRVIANNHTTCAICLEDFVSARDCPESELEQEVLRLLPCGHVLHKHCIDGWLTEVSARCPLCGKSVLLGDVDEMY